ncbi:hypothetical protein JVU11DRAFT_11446 [Chiua virens]|nr:hypothetical protein JVU11DRAFT_11446 [Chiua virens]
MGSWLFGTQGDCDDEGTILSFSTLNITTDAQLEEYIPTHWSQHATATQVTQLMKYYPSDPAQGSPVWNGWPNRSGKQNIWMYLNKRLKLTPFLGSFHASDLLNMYNGGDMASYLVRFVANLDPNVGDGTDLYWPQYDAGTNRTMLEFFDGIFSTQALTTDTYRAEAIAYVVNLTLESPF